MGIKWGYSASTQYGDVMRICGDQYIGKSELCGEYPPTPADSRGSASEKRGQDGQEANQKGRQETWGTAVNSTTVEETDPRMELESV